MRRRTVLPGRRTPGRGSRAPRSRRPSRGSARSRSSSGRCAGSRSRRPRPRPPWRAAPAARPPGAQHRQAGRDQARDGARRRRPRSPRRPAPGTFVPSVIAITAAAFAARPGASASSTTTTHRVPFVIGHNESTPADNRANSARSTGDGARWPRLDATDWAILDVLQDDARTSNRDLAAAVHVSPSTSSERVRSLRPTASSAATTRTSTTARSAATCRR